MREVIVKQHSLQSRYALTDYVVSGDQLWTLLVDTQSYKILHASFLPYGYMCELILV